ncbi:hypothetical protein [Streptomyces glaucus]|uniref:Uncharacterized protein n=1 Tax=Streptomyces glaucus TaxID=284029 RepID=A0ABN3KCR0_9ACTN
MLKDPYAVMRALLRAEAARSAPRSQRPKPDPRERERERPARSAERD